MSIQKENEGMSWCRRGRQREAAALKPEAPAGKNPVRKNLNHQTNPFSFFSQRKRFMLLPSAIGRAWHMWCGIHTYIISRR